MASLNDLKYSSFGTSTSGTAQKTMGWYDYSYGTVVIPTSDTVTSATVASSIAGYIQGITIVTPAMTGTGTVTFQLVDGKGGTLISQAQNESVTSFYGTARPVNTSMSWIATANGTQAALGTVTFAVHYQR